MTDSTQQSSAAGRKARFDVLLEAISNLFQSTSAKEQRRLLSSMEWLARPERRKNPRFLTFIPVTVDGIHLGIARNIGADGIFIRTSAILSVGQQVSVVFPSFNHGEPIRMTCEIVWKSKIGVGVKFTSPLSEELKQMVALL